MSLLTNLYVFAEEKLAFADGLDAVHRDFADEVPKLVDGQWRDCYNDDPVKEAYEAGQGYRTIHEWFFSPGAGWDLGHDYDGMREFHLAVAAQGQAASTPLKEPQRLKLDFNAWLMLCPDEQDLHIDDPVLVTRYLEGLAGVMYNAQYKTKAENVAYSVGEERRTFLGGNMKGMFVYALRLTSSLLFPVLMPTVLYFQRRRRRSGTGSSARRWTTLSARRACRCCASRCCARMTTGASSGRSTWASSPCWPPPMGCNSLTKTRACLTLAHCITVSRCRATRNCSDLVGRDRVSWK